MAVEKIKNPCPSSHSSFFLVLQKETVRATRLLLLSSNSEKSTYTNCERQKKQHQVSNCSFELRICADCNREIGHGRYLSYDGSFYHLECFRCHACNLPISDTEFSMSGVYPYHKSCYKEQYHPKVFARTLPTFRRIVSNQELFLSSASSN
ncbi:Da1-related [Thalictrum thalictroides]|uniref:Da1-related n=1 Tax=Thalictrum thalictroides TaxID=46969 RepID=A0A7J6WNQ9_THATH|nr:Da1-related [Thalictrum thalictroides]